MAASFETKPSTEAIELSLTSATADASPSTRALLWKLDLHILPLLYLSYIVTFIDRANIGNAKIEGILTDLHMGGNDYNDALIMHAVPFILLELPSSLALRRWRPGTWIAGIMFGWGVCTIGAGLARSYGDILVCRFLVGVFEAGLIPSCTFLMSQYYKKFEFQRRYSFFFTGSHIGGAFSGFLAYALAKMNNIGGYSGWRWIFIMEGLITVLLSIIAFFLVVPLPENAKFLTPDEKTHLLKRLEVENESSTEPDKTPLTLKQAVTIMTHWKIVLPLLSCFACNIAAASTTAFQPTVLKNLGFTSSQAQIHTIPVYMTSMFFCLLFGYLSDLLRTRYPFVLLGSLICLLGWAIELLAVKHINSVTGLGWPSQRYAGMFLIAIGESIQFPILIVWVSNCLRGRKERIVGFATLIGASQLGNLVSANVFLTSQEKYGYKTGFATGVGVGCLGILAASALVLGLWWENGGFERNEEDGGEEGNREGSGFRNTL